jgi:DNA primase
MLENIDLREVVKADVTFFKTSYDHIKIHCPFHDEKTASMMVKPDHYHCFGSCAAHGNAIDWAMKVKGLEYSEAIRYLQNFTSEELIIPKRREVDLKKWEYVCAHACYVLLKKVEKDFKDTYLFKRGLARTQDEANDLINTYAFGFIDKSVMINNRLRNEFENRLTIPYRNSSNKLQWLNTRATDQKETKYLNIGGKGHPYIINPDLILHNNQVVLVEGELDAITLDVATNHSLGIVGLAGGTMFSKNVSEILSRYIKSNTEILILFDNDDAGKVYAQKMQQIYPNSVVMCLADGYNDYGKDLNDYAVRYGLEFVRHFFMQELLKRNIDRRW